MTTGLRIAGTITGIVSYTLLTNGHQDLGVSLNIGTQALFVPFNIQHKCWDLVGTGAFFTAVSLHSLLS